MKLLHLLLFFFFTISLNSYAQFINPSNSYTVYQDNGSIPQEYYIDLTETNSNALSIVSGVSQYSSSQYLRHAFYYNNNLDMTFGNQQTIFVNASGNVPLKGIKAVRLRENHNRDDIVVLMGDELRVCHNSNGAIGGSVQTITGVSGTYIDKGMFDPLDLNDDIAILSYNTGNIRVYRNNNNGFLQTPAVLSMSVSGLWGNSIVKVKQVDYFSGVWFLANEANDRDEIIYSSIESGIPKIHIYKNNGNNTVSLLQSITFPWGNEVLTFDLEDLNNDGYNELVCVLRSQSDNKIRIYNNQNGIFNPSIYYETNATSLLARAKIDFADFNKDGYLDVIMANQGGEFYIHTNNAGTINPNPAQYFQHMHTNEEKGGEDHVMTYFNMEIADLYNKGGYGIVASYLMDHTGPSFYKIEVIHAQNIELPPSPPVIFGKIYVDINTGKRHPQILIYNKGDRDISTYKIEKKNLNINNGQWAELIPSLQADGPGLGQVYIDFTEELLPGPPGTYPSNLFYRVTSRDNQQNLSIPSNIASYSIMYEIGGGEERPVNGGDFEISEKFSISNYPNPFNPSTMFTYEVPVSGNVQIKIYNVTGQLIANLINEYKEAGKYSINFDASNLSGGIYFYNFITPKGIITKKLLLLK